jgi:hypothetical protein
MELAIPIGTAYVTHPHSGEPPSQILITRAEDTKEFYFFIYMC